MKLNTLNLLRHTILLRTRDRPNLIKIYIEMLIKSRYHGTLLIVDDSKEASHQLLYRYIKAVQLEKIFFKINLVRGPNHQSHERWNRMLKSTICGLELINTEYFSFSADDDFLFIKFINQGIKFLDQNPEYSAYTGPEIKLRYKSNSKFHYKIKTWNSSEFEDPLERVIDYLVRPSLAYYGVVRSSILKCLFVKNRNRLLFDRTGPAVRFFDEEIPWVAMVHAGGKIKYQEHTFQGIRGDFDSQDRIENLAKNGGGNNPYTHGSFEDFWAQDSRLFLAETLTDFLIMLQFFRSKYDPAQLDYYLRYFIWNILLKYRGNPISRISSELNIESNEKTFVKSIYTRLNRNLKGVIVSRTWLNNSELNAYINMIKS